jgi:DNA-directed RNA polymerase subunit L
MGNFNQLLGVANNLADSFISVTNVEFLKYIESLPIEKTKLFEINLLKENISPKELSSKKIKKVIQDYKDWFLSEIKKLKIELSDIDNVSIKVVYKSGKTFARYYICNVTIKAKGKDYTKKVKSSYS